MDTAPRPGDSAAALYTGRDETASDVLVPRVFGPGQDRSGL
jgi:hypothetical protein